MIPLIIFYLKWAFMPKPGVLDPLNPRNSEEKLNDIFLNIYSLNLNY